MWLSYCLGSNDLRKTLKVGATVYAGSVIARDTNKYGHAIPAGHSTTDHLGLSLDAATYSTSTEGTASCLLSPLNVYRGKLTASATVENTALTILANTSASTTVFTDADVGAVDLTGGTLFILSGANAGLSRVVTSTSSATSCTVTVAFPYSIAVGDLGVWVPYSTGSHKVQIPTYGRQIDCITAGPGTGIDAGVIECELKTDPISQTNPQIFVDFIVHDHILGVGPVD